VQAFGARVAVARGRWCVAVPPAGELQIFVVSRTEFCVFACEVVNQIKLCVIFMVKSRIELILCD
jgi:hypothetical protein